jgi:hypothetical protein
MSIGVRGSNSSSTGGIRDGSSPRPQEFIRAVFEQNWHGLVWAEATDGGEGVVLYLNPDTYSHSHDTHLRQWEALYGIKLEIVYGEPPRDAE